MSWKWTWNLILVPYWILESFVENRTTILLCNIASIGVFSGSDGCRPDLHYSWKPSPYVDNSPMNIVSKIRWKPSNGLRIIAVWSWRYIHFYALSVFGFQLVDRRNHERSWYTVRALVKPSGELCIPVTSSRALVYMCTSARQTYWRFMYLSI